MGPAAQNSLRTRPRFAWDTRSPPWTDGKGNQEWYKIAVYDWKEFINSLPDANPNKLTSPIQALVLKLQLCAQAADICAGITND